MSLKLHVVAASTRPGRKGIAVARWMEGLAREASAFDVRLVDLLEVGLPMFDEPNHPAQQRYEHEHTKRWSAMVAEADAFVFVVPEYNHGPTPALVNAINYLVKEWQYKPAGFASYGGVSGGLRSVQATKPMLNALKVVPLPEGVTVQMIGAHVGDDGVFKPDAVHEQGARQMLDELHRWAQALKTLRG